MSNSGFMSEYELRQKAIRDTEAMLDFREKKGREEGLAEGIALGEARSANRIKELEAIIAEYERKELAANRKQ